jgi:hypothetical protein
MRLDLACTDNSSHESDIAGDKLISHLFGKFLFNFHSSTGHIAGVPPARRHARKLMTSIWQLHQYVNPKSFENLKHYKYQG